MPRRLIIASITALLGAAVFAPISMAQMRGSGLGRGVKVSFNGRPHSHSFGAGAIFLGDPFYADYPVAPLTLPPQYLVVQPTTTIDTAPEAKSEPLMIELQGNRYVRFGGRQQPAERGTNSPPDYVEAAPGESSGRAQADLPPTLLIFRDGHREQVPGYAIVGATLYANEDYWQSGHWTKNIELSALNIAATVQANHDNGVKFLLPSAPNEVITRP